MSLAMLVNEAALVVADGSGIVGGHCHLREPVPPSAILAPIFLPELVPKGCAAKGYRPYLLGAAPGVAELAAEHLAFLAPVWVDCGTYAGSPAPTEEADYRERVRTAQADVRSCKRLRRTRCTGFWWIKRVTSHAYLR